MMGMRVQSGPQVAIEAFGRLPESIQKQQLENDRDRDRMTFEIEIKRIDADSRTLTDERAHELAKNKNEMDADERHESRRFWFAVGIMVVVASAVIVLLAKDQYAFAVPLITAVLGIVTGYGTGHSSGYEKARREINRDPKPKPES
jgi:Flp pilus assembly protein TadB